MRQGITFLPHPVDQELLTLFIGVGKTLRVDSSSGITFLCEMTSWTPAWKKADVYLRVEHSCQISIRLPIEFETTEPQAFLKTVAPTTRGWRWVAIWDQFQIWNPSQSNYGWRRLQVCLQETKLLIGIVIIIIWIAVAWFFGLSLTRSLVLAYYYNRSITGTESNQKGRRSVCLHWFSEGSSAAQHGRAALEPSTISDNVFRNM